MLAFCKTVFQFLRLKIKDPVTFKLCPHLFSSPVWDAADSIAGLWRRPCGMIRSKPSRCRSPMLPRASDTQRRALGFPVQGNSEASARRKSIAPLGAHGVNSHFSQSRSAPPRDSHLRKILKKGSSKNSQCLHELGLAFWLFGFSGFREKLALVTQYRDKSDALAARQVGGSACQ